MGGGVGEGERGQEISAENFLTIIFKTCWVPVFLKYIYIHFLKIREKKNE